MPGGCTAQVRHGPTGLPSVHTQPGSAEDVARQAASVAVGRMEIEELAADHAVAGWAQRGRQPESA